jgi:threonine dehydrogenase-like Zn-dependent dehydrogenase
MHLPISYVISSVEQKGVPNSCANLIRVWRAIDASFMATHRFSLEETKNALETVYDYRDVVIKAVITVKFGSENP